MSESLPEWLEPMAATLTQERFTDPDWLFERKFDGIRLLAFRDDRGVRLYSRARNAQQIPALAAAIERLPVRDIVLDGEITWDRSGTYHVFDVLWINGQDVTGRPLDERRAVLQSLSLSAPMERVEAIDHPAPWDLACAEGWEGVIAKRRDAPYEHKRSKAWLKMKCELTHEFVVGGFTDPLGSRVGLGALLVGYFDGDDFVYAGRVGTGFDRVLLTGLRAQLDASGRASTPFTRATGLPRVRAHWVTPSIVVRVAFLEWTGHGKLRHSRLLGIVSGRDPRTVTRTTR